MRLVVCIAHRAQRRVGLDRRIDVAVRRTVIDLPGAVGTLCLKERTRETPAQGMIYKTHEPKREAPLGLHAGVGDRTRDPMPVGLLPRNQPICSSAHGSAMRGARIVGGIFCEMPERC